MSVREDLERQIADSIRQDALSRLARDHSGQLFIGYTQALFDGGSITTAVRDGLRTRAAQLTPQLEVVR